MGCTKRLGELRGRTAFVWDALRLRSVRKRPWIARQRRASVPRTDPNDTKDHDHPSRDHALLHDDSGSGFARAAGLHCRRARECACSGHGRANPHCGPCQDADPAVGTGRDQVQIVFTGLRPGEKLYEDLFYASEEPLPTSQKKVLCTRANLMSWGKLIRYLSALENLEMEGSEASIRAKVRDIIPEYRYALSSSSSKATSSRDLEIARRLPPIWLAPAPASATSVTGIG